MLRRSAGSLFAALVVVAGLAAAEAQELTPETYPGYRSYLMPQDEELHWLGITWHPTLWQAVIQAHRQRAPIVVWATDGHPLGHACPDGIRARLGIWSVAKIQVLVEKNFVAAADSVRSLTARPGPEATLFQRFADADATPGRKSACQGIWAITPSGKTLGVSRAADPADVQRMLEQALVRWEQTPDRERWLTVDPTAEAAYIDRAERKYPQDGLVLRVVTRDLPRAPDEAGAGRGSWNQDFAWFRREEMRRLLPSQPAEGFKLDVPAELAARLARFHLVDNVRGLAQPFAPAAVERAVLTCFVERVKDGVARVRYEGATRASQERRGVETRLLGWAEFQIDAGRFTAFELVAVGTRWGSGDGNRREDDLGPAPFGAVLVLTRETARERVAPAFLASYGW